MGRRLFKPEPVFALGLALAVVSLVGSASWKVRLSRRVAHARAGARSLSWAIQRFYADYGQWPVAKACPPGDCRFGGELSNAGLLRALMAVEGEGNESHTVNPYRTPYFTAPAYAPGRSGLDHRGVFLDSWGMPFQVVLDTNLNGLCEVRDSVYDGIGPAGVLVWSCGPDRRSDTADDVLSWNP